MAGVVQSSDFLDRAGEAFSLAGKLGRDLQEEHKRQRDAGVIERDAWSKFAPLFEQLWQALLDLRKEMLNPPEGMEAIARELTEGAKIARKLRAALRKPETHREGLYFDFWPDLNSVALNGDQAVEAARSALARDDPFRSLDGEAAKPQPHARAEMPEPQAAPVLDKAKPMASFYGPPRRRDPEQPIERADVIEMGKNALHLAHIIWDYLPVQGEAKTKAHPQTADRWYADTVRAFRWIERLRNPSKQPFDGERHVINLDAAPGADAAMDELWYVLDDVCKHYGWQAVCDDSNYPASRVRDGGTIPPIRAALIDRVEKAAGWLLELNKEEMDTVPFRTEASAQRWTGRPAFRRRSPDVKPLQLASSLRLLSGELEAYAGGGVDSRELDSVFEVTPMSTVRLSETVSTSEAAAFAREIEINLGEQVIAVLAQIGDYLEAGRSTAEAAIVEGYPKDVPVLIQEAIDKSHRLCGPRLDELAGRLVARFEVENASRECDLNVGKGVVTRALDRERIDGDLSEKRSTDDTYVTLKDAAKLVLTPKKTLEHWKAKGRLPQPDVPHSGRRPAKWLWGRIRPFLEKQTGMNLPECPPRETTED